MAALPPPQPDAPSIALNITRKMIAPENAGRRGCALERCLTPSISERNRITTMVRLGTARCAGNGIERGSSKNVGMPAAPPLVVTDTVNGVALPFEICSVEGP